MMNSLIDLIRTLCNEARPLPTDVDPVLQPLGNIKAVLFDIYGTLFVSASGDIGLTAAHDRESAMREALAAEGVQTENIDTKLTDRFVELIREDHANRKQSGISHPEVDICEIWSRLLTEIGRRPESIERLAIRYECMVNPVWPMPGLEETLRNLTANSVRLGIISNAQFFTPILFPALTGRSVADWGFRESLNFWSWQHRIAKPSNALFDKAIAALQEEGIAASETLFIGNDIRNDIAPAAKAGFRTALFAGDKRSLRMRKSEKEDWPLPDIVITALAQLEKVLS